MYIIFLVVESDFITVILSPNCKKHIKHEHCFLSGNTFDSTVTLYINLVLKKTNKYFNNFIPLTKTKRRKFGLHISFLSEFPGLFTFGLVHLSLLVPFVCDTHSSWIT